MDFPGFPYCLMGNFYEWWAICVYQKAKIKPRQKSPRSVPFRIRSSRFQASSGAFLQRRSTLPGGSCLFFVGVLWVIMKRTRGK